MSRASDKEFQTVFASAARTATATATIATGSCAGLFFINVTATAATPSVVFTISGQDPVSGASYTILTSAAITSTGLTVLRVHPAPDNSSNRLLELVSVANARL